ncbi:MAG: dephospho-CoA kinase [Candidatus Hydrothermia bacterium]
MARKVIIVTGKAGSGKSTACKFLEELGIKVINVDKIAHDLLDEFKELIVRLFGKKVLSSDGRIDRSVLGELVFNDPVKMEELEGIVHPPLRNRVVEEVLRSQGNVVIDVAIPKKLKLYELADFVIFLDVDRDIIVKRLREKGWPEQKIESILKKQEDETPEGKGYLIKNNGSLEELRSELMKILKKEGVMH